MAEGVRVEVEGIKNLARTFRQVGNEGARDMLLAANREAAEAVEITARPNIVRRTGRLAATLRSTGTAKGGVVMLGKAKVPYAGPIHFGWPKRGIRPRPWLYEAMDRRHDDIQTLYLRRLDELLETVQGA